MSRSTELVRSGMAGEFTDTEHAIKIIKELESRIELAQWLAADPCTPGFVGEALRGRKLDEMPETVQAMIKEDMEQSDDA